MDSPRLFASKRIYFCSKKREEGGKSVDWIGEFRKFMRVLGSLVGQLFYSLSAYDRRQWIKVHCLCGPLVSLRMIA